MTTDLRLDTLEHSIFNFPFSVSLYSALLYHHLCLQLATDVSMPYLLYSRIEEPGARFVCGPRLHFSFFFGFFASKVKSFLLATLVRQK